MKYLYNSLNDPCDVSTLTGDIYSLSVQH